jgi:hypothetical protein
MHELPAIGQSEALTQWGRHLPSAQIRSVAQSLLSEQPLVVAVVDVVQAGTATAAAKPTPASHAATRPRPDR